MGAIFFEECTGGHIVFSCGGAKISDDKVLTAAHCPRWDAGSKIQEAYVWADIEQMHRILPTRDMSCRTDTSELRKLIADDVSATLATKVEKTYLPKAWEGMPHIGSYGGDPERRDFLGVDVAVLRIKNSRVLSSKSTLPFATEANFERVEDEHIYLEDGAEERFAIGQGIKSCDRDSGNPIDNDYTTKKLPLEFATDRQVFSSTARWAHIREAAKMPLENRLIPPNGNWACKGDSGGPVVEKRGSEFQLLGPLGITGPFREHTDSGALSEELSTGVSSASLRNPSVCAMFEEAYAEEPMPPSMATLCAQKVQDPGDLVFTESGLHVSIAKLIEAQFPEISPLYYSTFMEHGFDQHRTEPLRVELDGESFTLSLTENAVAGENNFAGVYMTRNIYGGMWTRSVYVLAAQSSGEDAQAE